MNKNLLEWFVRVVFPIVGIGFLLAVVAPEVNVVHFTEHIVVEDDREPIDPIEVEMQARAEALRYLNAQLAFSKHAEMVHEMLGLPPLPPLSEFINDLTNLIAKYK